jgi:exodeoxyribonuclease VII large subunit
LARGGGSIEDLWAFNDEGVARAIFASRYPVISGVGHETDFTIADFVADLRAPTPTGAAELATPITKEELRAALQGAEAQLAELINRQLEDLKQALQLAQSELRRTSPRLRILNNIQRLDELQGRLERAIQQQLQRKQNYLANAGDRLASLNPQAVLKRGYAIITDQATGQIISHTRQAVPWQPVWLQVQDGSIPAQITPPTKENKKDD